MFFEGLGTFLVVIIILVIVLAIVSSCEIGRAHV